MRPLSSRRTALDLLDETVKLVWACKVSVRKASNLPEKTVFPSARTTTSEVSPASTFNSIGMASSAEFADAGGADGDDGFLVVESPEVAAGLAGCD